MEDSLTKNASFLRRMDAAMTGVRFALINEKSFRTQFSVASLVLVFLIVFRPGWLWSALVIAVAGAVLAAELFNTAIESLIDGLHPGQAEFVRVAKDCAAGAVLVMSAVALLVGFALFTDVWLS